VQRGQVLPMAGNGGDPEAGGAGASGEGAGGGAGEAEIEAIIEVPESLTSQSRHSLTLSGSPPHGKLLIPLNRRDVRVVEGARLENDSGELHPVVPKHLFTHSIQRLPAAEYFSM